MNDSNLGEPLRTLTAFGGFWYSRRAVRSSPSLPLRVSFGASAAIALARASRASARIKNATLINPRKSVKSVFQPATYSNPTNRPQ